MLTLRYMIGVSKVEEVIEVITVLAPDAHPVPWTPAAIAALGIDPEAEVMVFELKSKLRAYGYVPGEYDSLGHHHRIRVTAPTTTFVLHSDMTETLVHQAFEREGLAVGVVPTLPRRLAVQASPQNVSRILTEVAELDAGQFTIG